MIVGFVSVAIKAPHASITLVKPMLYDSILFKGMIQLQERSSKKTSSLLIQQPNKVSGLLESSTLVSVWRLDNDVNYGHLS